jgi:hypothetical protein
MSAATAADTASRNVLVAHGLGQEIRCPGFHRLHAHGDVAMTREEYCRHRYALGCNEALGVEAAQTRHAHIENKATRAIRQLCVRTCWAEENEIESMPTEFSSSPKESRTSASSSTRIAMGLSAVPEFVTPNILASKGSTGRELTAFTRLVSIARPSHINERPRLLLPPKLGGQP